MFFWEDKYKYIAHRGLHSKELNIPENSLLSFKKSIESGFSIELDVQLTKDNIIVVFHDENLERMTGKYGIISDYTYDELKQCKLDNTECRIPSLKQVLNLVNGRVPLLIEIKNRKPSITFAKKLAYILKNYLGDFAVQSFNPLDILWFRLFFPQIKRGQLADGNQSCLLRKMIFNSMTKPDFISYQFKGINFKLYNKCKKNKIPLICWTICNCNDLKKMKAYCDGFIFENIGQSIIKQSLCRK